MQGSQVLLHGATGDNPDKDWYSWQQVGAAAGSAGWWEDKAVAAVAAIPT